MAKPFVFTRNNLFSDAARNAMFVLPKGWWYCPKQPPPYCEVSAKVWRAGSNVRLYINARSTPDANGHRRQGYIGWIDLADVNSGEGKVRLLVEALNAISSRKTRG